MAPKRKHDLPTAGHVYGRWTVLKGAQPGRRSRVRCRCGCGTIREVLVDSLVGGHSVSCGCFSRKHPETYYRGASASPLFPTWTKMCHRCHRPSSNGYKWYGAHGIAVCAEWRNDFYRFEAWALSHGYRRGLEIDRIDGRKGYSPDNCRWVTPSTNKRNMSTNRRITAFGETKCMSSWAQDRRCVVSYTTLRSRLRRGWGAEKAIATKAREVCCAG